MSTFPLGHPPEFGLIQLEVPVAPVSFQATARKKAPIISAIRDLVSPASYLLSGDVKLEIQWHVSEASRYEGDASADVDNIIKPILDALSGPEGLVIDDCQIQELTCFWTDLVYGPERVSIELRFIDDTYVLKDSLMFLNVQRGLYFPLNGDVSPDNTLVVAERVIERFKYIERLVELGAHPEDARQSRPIQRVFHKSRVARFRLTTIDELRSAGTRTGTT